MITFKQFLNETAGLDKRSLSDQQLAKLHRVPLKSIRAQIKKGNSVETEHSSNKKVTDQIARDHVKEDPKYYDKLAKMERK